MNPEEFTASTQADPPEHNELTQEVTMPLGTGDFSAEPGHDPLAGTQTRKKLSGGSVLIVAVVLIAVGGLFSMRKLAQVTAAAGVDSEIETTIETFLKSLTGQETPEDDSSGDRAGARANEAALAVLSETYSERQVPLSNVQRNPFIIYQRETVAPLPTEDPGLAASQQEQRWREKRKEREQIIRSAGDRLTLKSILGGSNPLAIIDGKIVRVGDTFDIPGGDVAFRIRSISTGMVELVAQVEELNLTVEITLQLQRDR